MHVPDEHIPAVQVVEFVKNPEYSHFSRIIFDTAPTGHTLRLLTLPDFLDASLGTPEVFPAYHHCHTTGRGTHSLLLIACPVLLA